MNIMKSDVECSYWIYWGVIKCVISECCNNWSDKKTWKNWKGKKKKKWRKKGLLFVFFPPSLFWYCQFHKGWPFWFCVWMVDFFFFFFIINSSFFQSKLFFFVCIIFFCSQKAVYEIDNINLKVSKQWIQMFQIK